MGCDTAIVSATAYGSMKSFERVGYEQYYEMPFADFRDEQGDPLYVPKDGPPAVKCYYKKLC